MAFTPKRKGVVRKKPTSTPTPITIASKVEVAPAAVKASVTVAAPAKAIKKEAWFGCGWRGW
jgi:hypothetical protein